MLNRPKFLRDIGNQLRIHSACAVLGPRQCGKTTLALEFGKTFGQAVHHFDLENPEDVWLLSQ